MASWNDDLKLVDDAIHRDGLLADTRREQLIARVGIEVVATLIRKNRDYGGSAFEPPVLMPQTGADSGILVRMSDKVHRIRRLISGAKANVVSESLIDTFRDLAGYAILWIVSQFLNKAYSDAPEIPSGSDTGPAQGSTPSGVLSRASGDPETSPWAGTDKVHSCGH